MQKHSELISGSGGHYSIYKAIHGMEVLRLVFPDGQANEMNFCLFSTSGVHGSYRTIEEEEQDPGYGVTFLIVQPRIVSLTYGNAYPTNEEDFNFLYKLRESAREVLSSMLDTDS